MYEMLRSGNSPSPHSRTCLFYAAQLQKLLIIDYGRSLQPGLPEKLGLFYAPGDTEVAVAKNELGLTPAVGICRLHGKKPLSRAAPNRAAFSRPVLCRTRHHSSQIAPRTFQG